MNRHHHKAPAACKEPRFAAAAALSITIDNPSDCRHDSLSCWTGHAFQVETAAAAAAAACAACCHSIMAGLLADAFSPAPFLCTFLRATHPWSALTGARQAGCPCRQHAPQAGAGRSRGSYTSVNAHLLGPGAEEPPPAARNDRKSGEFVSYIMIACCLPFAVGLQSEPGWPESDLNVTFGRTTRS